MATGGATDADVPMDAGIRDDPRPTAQGPVATDRVGRPGGRRLRVLQRRSSESGRRTDPVPRHRRADRGARRVRVDDAGRQHAALTGPSRPSEGSSPHRSEQGGRPMSVQAVQLSPRRTRNGSRHSLRVALVAMPFSEINRPSIQVGILQAVALEAGFQTDTFHLYLDMAAMIGVDTYEIISRLARAAIGDWIFSPAAFGDEAPDPDGTAFRPSRAATNILQDAFGQDWRDILCKVRADIPKYLDEVMASVQWADYPVVGFSSTFQQGVASLALARRLKEARPGTVIIFGGSNVEGPMGAEFVRVFDCVDCVVNGEAELVLPAVLEAVESGASLESIPGVATRTQPTAERQVVEDLNISPAPMYEEYFERARRLNLAEISRPGFVDLPLETARGCRWGA